MNLPNNKNPITESQNLPDISGFKGTITQQVEASADLTKAFFQMPYGQSNGIVRPLLCEAADYFLKSNNSPDNLSAALTISLSLYSVRLGYPLPIILQSDDAQAVHHLLDICKQIAPKGSFIEVQELSWEQLYENPDKFRGKVIICTTPKGCKKAMPDIQNLILHGRSARQVPYKSNMGKGFNQHQIKYPVGFIGVETTDKKNALNHPAILKIPVSSNDDPGGYAVIGYENFEQTTEEDLREIHRIKTIFRRLRPCKVQVPFINQISLDLMRQQPTDFVIKFNMLQKMLSLLSITNKPSLITPDELIEGYMGINPSRNCSIDTIETITATKVEYAQMAQLLKGILPIRDEHYTPVQVIIFEAVKQINKGKLTKSIIDLNDDIQVLSTLYKDPNSWAILANIFEKANSKSHRILSIQKIEGELNKLQRLGIISKKKVFIHGVTALL